MINQRLSTKLSALALALLLAGCGGGGYYNEGGNSNTGGGENSGGNPEEVQSITIKSFLLQDSAGDATQTISALGATAVLKVTDASGNPVSGAIVSFSGENMTFSTTNSSVFTNADGEAIIGVLPTNSNITGAYIITATATFGEQTATLSKNVSFVKTDIIIEQLVASPKEQFQGALLY